MKWIGWFTKLTFTVMLVSGLSVTTTFVMMNMYMDQLLKRLNLSAETPAVSFSDFLAYFHGQGNTMNDKEGNDDQQGIVDHSDIPSDSVNGGVGPNQDASNDSNTMNMDAIEVWKREASISQWQDALIMSSEDFMQKRDQLSDEDKMKIFTLVVTKIPPDALQKLSEYMEDGITIREFTEIQAIFQQYLNEEEYDELTTLIDSYLN